MSTGKNYLAKTQTAVNFKIVHSSSKREVAWLFYIILVSYWINYCYLFKQQAKT